MPCCRTILFVGNSEGNNSYYHLTKEIFKCKSRGRSILILITFWAYTEVTLCVIFKLYSVVLRKTRNLQGIIEIYFTANWGK